MPTDTVSIEQFIKANGITMTSVYASHNPNMDGSADMDNYKVTLSCRVLRQGFDTWHSYKGKLGSHQYSTHKMTLYFSKGVGHHGAEPTADEVLGLPFL